MAVDHLHVKRRISPDDFARDGNVVGGVGSNWYPWSLCLKSKTHATAQHKITATEADSTITAMTLRLGPLLCCCPLTSTPRGCMVLPLLSPGYGWLLMVSMSEAAEGGEGGRPVHITILFSYSTYSMCHQDDTIAFGMILYLDIAHIIHHNHQKVMIL